MMPLSAGVVPFMNAVSGSLYTCQKHPVKKSNVNKNHATVPTRSQGSVVKPRNMHSTKLPKSNSYLGNPRK